MTAIQRQTRNGGGLSIRVLKESWKEAPQAIEELEKEGEVYVTRTLKDGQMRMVFWNEVKPTEDQGGMAVEKGKRTSVWSDRALSHIHLEFHDLWHGLEVPNDVDLLKALASEGLQATAAAAPVLKAGAQKKKGKKAASRQRQVRITNTHLKGVVDLSRDYVAPGTSTK